MQNMAPAFGTPFCARPPEALPGASTRFRHGAYEFVSNLLTRPTQIALPALTHGWETIMNLIRKIITRVATRLAGDIIADLMTDDPDP